MRIQHRAILIFATVLSILPAAAWAYEQPPRTISLGIQGDFGHLWGGGYLRTLETETGTSVTNWIPMTRLQWGFGVSFALRYSLDATHALGLTMADLRFNNVDPLNKADPKDQVTADQFQTNVFLVDYYIYMHRRPKVSYYTVIGGGFHKVTFRDATGGSTILNGSFVANFGLGMEYFVRRPFSVDASLRGYYFGLKWPDIEPDSPTASVESVSPHGVAAELAIGVHYYLLH